MGIPIPQKRKINEKENFNHFKYKSFSLINKIIESSSSWTEIGKKLGYSCKVLSSNVRESILNRYSMLGMELKIENKKNVMNKTKRELFKERKNWQSARSAIRKNAQALFLSVNPNPECFVCGYRKHIEVAHIKAVSEFDDNALISEINSIDNLIGLCPNHHWEFDNGILKI